MNLAVSQQSSIDGEIAVVSERLRRCEDADVARFISSMMAAGLVVPRGIDPDKVNIVYSLAVKGASRIGLATAVKKFIRGEYDGQSYSFMPTPPELGNRARAEDEHDWRQLQRLRDRKDSILAGVKPTPKDQGSIERIRKLVASVKNSAMNIKRERDKTGAVDVPLSPEKREEIRLMLALPDRGDATFEEREYRSKMAAKLED